MNAKNPQPRTGRPLPARPQPALPCRLASLLAGCALLSAAEDPVLVGQWPDEVRGNPNNVVIIGHLAYVAAGIGGLFIYDVSDPAAPVRLGGYDTPGEAVDVAVSGGLAYVADTEAGLQIIDVGNPAAPVRIGAYATEATALGVAINGGMALLADDTAGLQVIDVSNPLAPVRMGGYNTTGRASAVTVAGTLAYVADGLAGLQIVNLANPAVPALVSTFRTAGWAQDVVVVADHAYVADGQAGVMLIDVSDPAAPSRIGSHDTDGYAFSVSVQADRVFVADAEQGVLVLGFDPENPTTFSVLGSRSTPGSVSGITLVNNLAYLANRTVGLEAVDFTDPAAPVTQGVAGTGGYSWAVAALGNIALVADDSAGLAVLDLSAPAAPLQVGTDEPGSSVYGVAVADGLAYVAANEAGLRILSVTNPAAPVLMSTYVTAGPVGSVAVSGTLALASSLNGVEVINVTTPATPTRLFYFETGAEEVAVSGTLAVVAAGFEGVHLLDLSNPANVQLLATVETAGYAGAVALSGQYALVAVDEAGLEIFDLSNPAAPLLAGSYPVAGFTWDVAVNGAVAALATDQAGVELVDITDPANPLAAGSFDTAGRALGVAFLNDLLLVADGERGLAVVDLNPEPSAPFIVRDPLSRTNTTLTIASFTAAAGGSQPLTYQWRQGTNQLADGGRVSGATSDTLVIRDTLVDDAGEYTVVVANAMGSATSQAATLTVIGEPQTLTFEPLPDVDLAESPLTLAATASSGLPVSFELVTGPAGVAGSALTLTGIGTVTVRATQPGGGLYAPAAPVERSFTVTANVCPTLALTTPTGDFTVPIGSLVTIQWQGEDPNDEATFRLYRDADDNPDNGNETLLLGPVSQESGFSTLDTATLAPGTYWIYGRLNDAQCEAVAYAPGRVTVVDPPDLAFATNPFEVTQAIQTADNQLPLVAGKATVARVFVRVTDREVAEAVTVELSGLSNGTPLPGSPLTTAFAAPAVTVLDRGEASHSATFTLPESWTAAGAVTLQATVSPAVGTPLVSGAATLTFTTRRTPVVWVIPINLGTAEVPVFPTAAEIAAQLSYATATFPVPEFDAVTHYWTQVGPTDGLSILDALQDYLVALEVAWLDSFLLTGTEPFPFPEALYGFTPQNVPRSSSDSTIVGSLAYLTGQVAMGYWGESQEGTLAHGLNHAWGPTESWGRHVGAASGNDPAWGCGTTTVDPFWTWTNDGLQEIGYDTRTFTPIAASTPDFMSWCQAAGTPAQWVSTYRWQHLFDYFAPAAGAAGLSQARRASAPGGIQVVTRVTGTLLSAGGGTLTGAARAAGRLDAANPAGAYRVLLLNAQGGVLEDFPFAVSFEGEAGPLSEATFRLNLPVRDGLTAVRLLHGQQVLDELTVSPGVPTVRLLAPNGGETWLGLETVTWEAADPDGDPLTFTVSYSTDGLFWLPLSVGPVTGNSYQVSSALLAGAPQARIRVTVSDGFNTAADQSDAPFTVPDKAPTVTLVSPVDGGSYPAGQELTLEAFASDLEDQSLPDAAYAWSLDDSPLGTGRRLTVPLPAGARTIRVRVTDSAGNTAEATAAVNAGIQLESAQAQDGTLQLSFRAAAGQAYVIWFRDSLSGGAWQQLGSVPAAAARIVPIVDSLPANGVQRFYRISTP